MTPVEDQDAVNQREWTTASNWSGWRYSSRRDNRLWVPKRPMTGSGDALNFGHPGAKTVIAGMAIIPAAFVLLFVLYWLAAD